MPTRRLVILVILAVVALAGQDLLRGLGQKQDYRSRRVSSYDRSGGNRDSIVIEPGKTAVLAEIEGPGGRPSHLDDDRRRTVLRPEDRPAHLLGRREIPLGRGADRRLLRRRPRPEPEFRLPPDHLFVGGPGQELLLVHALPPLLPDHGQERGDAAPSTRSTITSITASSPIFPPTRPISMPSTGRNSRPTRGANYLLLDAEGAGHYVGCNLSVLQRAMGWWGEGDDMIQVDGESKPSLHGTGSEDYFSDAWGMREGQSLFYGCPLQEEDFQAGSKATVYRFHIPDPVPFKRVHRGDDRARPRERPRAISSPRSPTGTRPSPTGPSRPSRPSPRGSRSPSSRRRISSCRSGTRNEPGDAGRFRRPRRRAAHGGAAALAARSPRITARPARAIPCCGPTGPRPGRGPSSASRSRSAISTRSSSTSSGRRRRATSGSWRPRAAGPRGRGPGPLRRLRQGNGPRLRRSEGPPPRAGPQHARLRDGGQGRPERGQRPLLRRLRPPARGPPVHPRMEPRRPLRRRGHGRPADGLSARNGDGAGEELQGQERRRPSAGGPSRPTIPATSGSTISSGPTSRPSSTAWPRSSPRTTGTRRSSSAATTASGSGSTASSSTPTPSYRAAEPDLDRVAGAPEEGLEQGPASRSFRGPAAGAIYVRFADPDGRAALRPQAGMSGSAQVSARRAIRFHVRCAAGVTARGRINRQRTRSRTCTSTKRMS